MKTLAITTLLSFAALPAAAQWQSYHAPGSSFTEHTGPNGWSAESYHSPGSSWTDTTIRGPQGQRRNCSTYHYRGTSFSDTDCN